MVDMQRHAGEYEQGPGGRKKDAGPACVLFPPLLMSQLARWGWYGVPLGRAQWCSLCDSTQPAFLTPCLAALNTGMPFAGPLPVTLTLTLTLTLALTTTLTTTLTLALTTTLTTTLTLALTTTTTTTILTLALALTLALTLAHVPPGHNPEFLAHEVTI
eukprot:355494-Chlamydomonas_euryale.AAC.4